MDRIQKQPMYRFLMVLTIASMAGLQTWSTLFNKFAVEIVNLEGNHIGMIQSIREIPGFLALLVVFVLLLMKEHKLSTVSIITLGVGVAITGFLPSYPGLIFTTIIMSFGFHYYETTNQSLTLQYFDRKISPWVFGKLRSIASATNIGVGILIFILAAYLSYEQIFLLLGILIILTGFWGYLQNPANDNLIPQRKNMIVRKKYWLFYFLTFMAGARRQIFIAFAVFLLVKKFDYSIQEITALFVINNVINYFLSPLIGKAIIKYGERRVLSLEYSSLIFIFIAYAFTDSKLIVALLYISDIFKCSPSSTFFNKS